MLQIISSFIYSFINYQYFSVLLGIWLFVCVIWTERWKLILNRLQKLVSKPIIFKKDPIPQNTLFYPRAFMEDAANDFRNTLREPFSEPIKVFAAWFTELAKLVFSREHPYRILGYIFNFVSFLFLVLADSIAVANSLVVLDLLQRNSLPQILNRFDLAVAGGALFAFVVCAVMFFEIRSDDGEFSEWSSRDKQTKSLALGIALLIIILSLMSLISFSLFNLIKIGRVDSNPILTGILNWGLYGLVPINSSLAVAITFLDAMRGFLIVIVLLGWILIGVLYLLNALAIILGTLAPYILDILFRIIYIIVEILVWFIFTPVVAIPYLLSLVFQNIAEDNFKA